MAAYEHTTLHAIVDFAQSHFIDGHNHAAPTGYVKALPPLWIENEYEIILYCYEYYDATAELQTKSEFGAAATAKLYIKRRDSDELPVTLDASVTVGQVGATGRYYVLTAGVAASAISALFANQECLLYWEVLDTGAKRTIAQFVRVQSADGTGADNLVSRLVPCSQFWVHSAAAAPGVGDDSSDGFERYDLWYDTAGAKLYRCDAATVGAATWTEITELDSYPGPVTYEIDGAATLPLPTVAEQTQQDITFSLTAAATVSITGTVNADAGGISMTRQYTAARVIADGSAYYNLNHTVIVR